MIKLLKPFDYFTNQKMFQNGLLITLIGVVLAILMNARLDGVLDVHFEDNIRWYQPVLDIVINLFSMTLVLFLTAKLVHKKARLEDVFLIVIWARMFGYLLPIFNINNFLSNLNNAILNSFEAGQMMPNLSVIEWCVVLLFSIMALIKLGLFVWWIWYGLSVTTNQRSLKTALLALFSIVLAEVLSKIMINYLHHII